MFTKRNLKSARNCIQQGKFDEGLYYAEEVLNNEANNYNALLFAGKAAFELNDPAKSFEYYQRAIDSQPTNTLAWKGMLLLHEHQQDAMQYLDSFEGLIKCYEEADDIHGAGDVLIKATKFMKNKHIEAQKRFLYLKLPDSPIFAFLEPRLSKIAETLGKLVHIIEQQEAEIINKTISKQRFRVGKGEASSETKYKVYSSSNLPALYNGLINSTLDDEERQITEGKLLHYVYNLLRVSPEKEKPPMQRDVAQMSNGMVVVRNPEPLAWKLDLDWSDPVELKDLDYETLSYYAKNFGDPSSRVLSAYMHSEISPFVEEASEDEDWSPVAVLEMISDGFDNDQEFILSYRILGQLYLGSQEYESAADVAKKGLAKLNQLHKETLTKFIHASHHLVVILGTAYTYYQAPKNFGTAIEMFDVVLKYDPRHVQAAIGKSLVCIEKGQLEEAEKLLETIHHDHPQNFQALFELSWCHVLQGKDGMTGLKQCLDLVTGTDPESKDYRARIWWRMGTSRWNRDETDDAFNSFVKALQENPNYAPAYTSLGVFYADAAGDKVRATKCFFKAFELDSGEIDAAYRLATEFADNGEWGLVEVVANRTIESERLRTTFSNRDQSWPYRALGIVGLNKRDYAQAVQFFQSSLRITPKDANSWIGLGEAYTNSGRFVAAAKAFDRALRLDPGNWIAQYQLGIVKRQVMSYDEAIAAFSQVLESQPVMSVKVALIETYLLSARYNVELEFYSQGVDKAVACIKSALSVVQDDSISTQDIWKIVGDACDIFLTVESQEDKVPVDNIVTILSIGCDKHDIDFDSESLKDFVRVAFRLALESCRKDMSSRAMAHFNLGVMCLKYGFDEDAVPNLKKAIQLEHRNCDFWNAYGCAVSKSNARVAQHCFIRSLSFNIAQPNVWANLGALYLLNSDVELAEEAFEKTQSIDPEYVPAWIGRGIIENVNGKRKEADALFDQSFLISDGGDGLAKLLYGLSILERTQDGNSLVKGYSHELETGVLALQKYLMLAPKNELGLTVQGMLSERDNNFEYAIDVTSKHCQVLEAKYEHTEDEEDLTAFLKAKAHLARLYLAAGSNDEAVEHAQFANDIQESLSATLTAGLGHYFSGSFDDAIDCFKRALEISEEDQDVVVLLAQVLWAHGGAGEKDVALDQLYGSVGSKGASLKITLLLGAIGLADNSDLVGAAREELEDLPLDTLAKDGGNNVQEILSLIKGSKQPWQRAAFLWPSSYKVWKHLDQRVALRLAKGGSANGVSAEELSDSYISQRTIDACQKAVFYSPWNVNAWKGLSQVVSSS